MRLETFYRDPRFFFKVANHVQDLLAELKREVPEEFADRATDFRHAITYIQNRITELKLGIEFSYLLSEAERATKVKASVIDLDKVVGVKGSWKGIFELKVRRKTEDEILVNWSQYNFLREVEEKLNVPVFYIIRSNGEYRFIKLRFWRRELLGSGQKRDSYVRIPLADGLSLDRKGMVEALADVLTEPGREYYER